MATEIATKVKPLFDDLLKIGFNEFTKTNEFVRECNALNLTEIYTEAHNESQKNIDAFDFLSLAFGNSDLLAEFLNKLYAKDQVFATTLSKLVAKFLEVTTNPIYPENILTDLGKLGLSGNDYSKLSAAFAKAEGNYLNKARYLKQMMISRATGGGADEDMYNKLRADFIKSDSLKSYLPDFLPACDTVNDFWQFIKGTSGYQARRVFLAEAFAPLITFLTHEKTAIIEITTIDNIYIQDAWKKSLDRMVQDPEGAITSARTLLETVCKHILDSFGEQYDETADLPKLYKATAKSLQLSPDQHTEQIFKQILGGCQSVVEGLGSLRNKLSDAHGKGSKAIKPSSRHAGLAVNLSGTMCQFLLLTFEEKLQKNKVSS